MWALSASLHTMAPGNFSIDARAVSQCTAAVYWYVSALNLWKIEPFFSSPSQLSSMALFPWLIFSCSIRMVSFGSTLLDLTQRSSIVSCHGSITASAGLGVGSLTARRVRLIWGVRVRFINVVILQGA